MTGLTAEITPILFCKTLINNYTPISVCIIGVITEIMRLTFTSKNSVKYLRRRPTEFVL
jgi:hypothetical protein